MSNMNETKKQVSTIAQRAAELDAIASETALAFGSANQGVAMALQLADGIVQMRALLDTPEIKTKIIALQDTRLGFRTDRDPKSGKGKPAYEWPVVRECALEALLRGVTLCGNQFNIIANGTYLTKEGYQWKLSKVAGFADFKPVLGVPQGKAGGAIVHCEATWTLKGQPGNLSLDIAAKGDDYTGVDGYVGKAERKFYKRIYEIVSGKTSDPDGSVDDRPMLNAPSAPAEGFHPPKRIAHSEPERQVQNKAQAPPAADSTAPEQPQETAPEDDVPMEDAPTAPLTPVGKLTDMLERNGITFGDMCAWAERSGHIPDATSFSDPSELRATTLEWVLKNEKRIVAGVKGGAK